jgi:hypothetical protein
MRPPVRGKGVEVPDCRARETRSGNACPTIVKALPVLLFQAHFFEILSNKRLEI